MGFKKFTLECGPSIVLTIAVVGIILGIGYVVLNNQIDSIEDYRESKCIDEWSGSHITYEEECDGTLCIRNYSCILDDGTKRNIPALRWLG